MDLETPEMGGFWLLFTVGNGGENENGIGLDDSINERQ